MKQIEITVRVNNTLNDVDKILTKQGFKVIRKSRIEDKYLYNNIKPINKENIIEVLSNCILIRYLCVDEKDIFKKITYKNKIYNNEMFISEEKINININDIDSAIRLFEAVKFKKIVDVNYDVIVYEKEGLEFAFQDVENLGLLMEYESLKDFDWYTNEDIVLEKKKMVELIKNFNLDISSNYDVKKAYELILKG